jgi:hypothetical protein
MAFIVKHERTNFTPASEGLHQAVCVDVIDLGIQKTQYGDKHQCRISWQVEETNPDTGKRQVASKLYTVSLHEKASLRKDLETWRGRKFTEEELTGFDLDKLLGVNCQIQIVHNIADDGRVFGNIQAIVPIGRGMTALRGEDYVRMKDRPTAATTGPRPVAAATGTNGAAAEDDVPF